MQAWHLNKGARQRAIVGGHLILYMIGRIAKLTRLGRSGLVARFRRSSQSRSVASVPIGPIHFSSQSLRVPALNFLLWQPGSGDANLIHRHRVRHLSRDLPGI